MRDIKFRVRNLKHNLFEDLSDILITFDNAGCEIYTYEGSVLDGYELNQYTGLKDKNGKEIYEGDICKYVCGKSEWIAEVVFHYGMFTFPIKEKPLGRYVYIHNVLERELEVIGNIYENPELLEGN